MKHPRKFRFTVFDNDGAMRANSDEPSSLEEARQIYLRLRHQGFIVIPRDEKGAEYWMNDRGQLLPKP